MKELIKKAIAECIGTFVLVFVACGVAADGWKLGCYVTCIRLDYRCYGLFDRQNQRMSYKSCGFARMLLE